MFDRLALRLLSSPRLSRMTAKFADVRWPGVLLRPGLRAYIRHFDIDMGEVPKTLDEFATFNTFFTRRLAEGTRPIDRSVGAVVSPSDGLVVAAEAIPADGRIGQIKGTKYTLASLLEDPEAASRYAGGYQITVYLSPRDYHRVHAPTDGKVTSLHHIAGRCYPVNPWAAAHVREIYAKNERLIFEMHPPGESAYALVMVGAANVARMQAAFHPLTTNQGNPSAMTIFDTVRVARGDEVGCFNLGSTVVLLFTAASHFTPSAHEGDRVKMGELLGRFRS